MNPATTKQDTRIRDRRLARRLLEDPEFHAAFQREHRVIAAVGAIIHSLDALREQHGLTKTEVARAIDNHPAAVRRLLTGAGNPELRTVVAIAEALATDVGIIPRKRTDRAKRTARRPA